MSEAGYTLTETLAALAILGLAIGGLTSAMQVMGRQQAAANGLSAHITAARAGETAVERFLAGHGPFRAHEPDRLAGDGRAFAFDCGAAEPCRVTVAQEAAGLVLKLRDETGAERSLPLLQPGPARLVYQGAVEAVGAWPPAGPGRQPLRSISLVQTTDQGDAAILEARLVREQAADCAFDAVMQDCR